MTVPSTSDLIGTFFVISGKSVPKITVFSVRGTFGNVTLERTTIDNQPALILNITLKIGYKIEITIQSGGITVAASKLAE